MAKNTIVLDVDDVLLDCNGFALKLLSEEKDVSVSLDVEKIFKWGETGLALDERFKFFKESFFYENQPALKGAQNFIKTLANDFNSDIIIATAVALPFASKRSARILELFPEIKEKNILLGCRKDILVSDFMLDDGFHNIETSKSKVPVLFERPWNKSERSSNVWKDLKRRNKRISSVKNYDEFLLLIEKFK